MRVWVELALRITRAGVGVCAVLVLIPLKVTRSVCGWVQPKPKETPESQETRTFGIKKRKTGKAPE
eukprot:931993-Rhodomonas_salina.1